MDTIALPLAEPVTVETANGFLVVSKFRLARPAVPPYAYDYCYDHYRDLSDAHEHYSDLERGEYAGWLPHAIIPCRDGMPLAGKKVL